MISDYGAIEFSEPQRMAILFESLEESDSDPAGWDFERHRETKTADTVLGTDSAVVFFNSETEEIEIIGQEQFIRAWGLGSGER